MLVPQVYVELVQRRRPGLRRGMLLMAGREAEEINKAADRQALSMLNFAWGYVFEAPTGTLHFMDIRYCRCGRTYYAL